MAELQAMLGNAATFMLMQALRRIQINIDAGSHEVTIWKDRQYPVKVTFEEIEHFVNEAN